MPCIYTHESFGKKVTEQLPEELQLIIYKHQKEFNAGLQGPDFLFFYHPVLKLRTNQLGYWQHSQPLNEYLNRLIPILREEGTDSGVYAYTLGFLCHFMLDSECHTYVIPLSQKRGFNHLAIENEFDRYLMKVDGHHPVTYPVWKLIDESSEVIDAMKKAYHPFRLTEKSIRKSLRGMRFYKKLLTSGKSFKRVMIRLGMRISAHYNELEGHMLDLKPKKYAPQTNQTLKSIYEKAIPMTTDILQDFHLSVTNGKPLNERFSCNFKSNRELAHPD
jgi:hypothetical protein